MAASRFSLFGTSVLRHRTNVSPIPAIRLSFSPSRFTCSAAVDTVTADSTDSHHRHPWPEWVTFIDRLKTKGYFSEALPASADYDADMNVFKDACLTYARDRFDVFNSLSRKDIQTVVEGGCPNLFRKAVNSAKRLRAFVRLDEGDVCSACNLRGSCDRAYVLLKESEAAARTVDIVRILLFYALDPLVTSGEKPPGRELVEVSARKLLSELIELSDTPLDPALAKPAAIPPRRKEQHMNLTDDEMPQNVQMKKGDWICPNCNFLNFARNTQCMKCREDGPKRDSLNVVEMKKGDWTCPECNFMNFSRNIRCLKCRAEGPKRVDAADIPMKKGDWNCPQCAFMNFASKTECFRCREPRPKRQLNPGEWECPSCDFVNYRRNTVCLKCNRDQPKEAATPYEEHVWKKPSNLR